jgi:hypothetical protein
MKQEDVEKAVSPGCPVDGLYDGLNVDLLTVADACGVNFYSANDSESRRDILCAWGMDDALEQNESVSWLKTGRKVS